MKQFFTYSCALMLSAACCILASCGGSEKTEVTIQPSVAITLLDTSEPYDIKVQFAPSKGATTFAYAIGTAEDEVSFLDGTIPGYTEVSNNNTLEMVFSDLEPDTKYVIYAIAFTEDIKRGPLSKASANTYTDTFMVTKQYVSDNSAGFNIFCSDDYYKYVYYLGSADDKEAFINNEITGIQNRTETFEYTENFFGIASDQEFVFYVKGYARDGRETKLFEIPIKTAALDSDEIPNVKIEFGKQDFFQQDYTITPNAKCKKVVFYQKREVDFNEVMNNKNNWAGNRMKMFNAWQAYTEAEITEMTQTYKATDNVLNASPKLLELDVDVPVDLYVLIYDENYQPSSVKHMTHRTPAFQEALATPKAKDFEGTVVKVDGETQTIEFSVKYTGNDLTAYFFDIVDKNWYDGQVTTPGIDPYFLHDWLLKNKLTAGGFVYRNYNIEKLAYQDKELKMNSDFYLAICPMNDNGPRTGGWGEVVLLPFNTRAK